MVEQYLNQYFNTEESYGVELMDVSAVCEIPNILRFCVAVQEGAALSGSATALFVSKLWAVVT